jgi:hypothetical protein
VEEIIVEWMCNGRKEYLIRWEGYIGSCWLTFEMCRTYYTTSELEHKLSGGGASCYSGNDGRVGWRVNQGKNTFTETRWLLS